MQRPSHEGTQRQGISLLPYVSCVVWWCDDVCHAVHLPRKPARSAAHRHRCSLVILDLVVMGLLDTLTGATAQPLSNDQGAPGAQCQLSECQTIPKPLAAENVSQLGQGL